MSCNVTDLQQIVTQWAYHIFKATKDKSTKNLKFGDLTFEISWKKMRFKSEKPEFTEKKLKENSQRNLIFKAVYENRTAVSQDHHFATNRSTVCKCVTIVTEGFTTGTCLGLQLGLPNEVMMATASYGREVTMETTEESEVEEMIEWSVDTTIKVQPNHRSTVSLEVLEQQFTAKFHMITRITGHVIVSVFQQKDNNNVLLEIIEGEISEVLQAQTPELDSAAVTMVGKTVHWRLTGTCNFVYGIQQHVVVEEEDLEGVTLILS